MILIISEDVTKYLHLTCVFLSVSVYVCVSLCV